jgi:hypothetical protein
MRRYFYGMDCQVCCGHLEGYSLLHLHKSYTFALPVYILTFFLTHYRQNWISILLILSITWEEMISHCLIFIALITGKIEQLLPDSFSHFIFCEVSISFFSFLLLSFLHLLTCVYIVCATFLPPPPRFQVQPVPSSSPILLKRKHKR